MVIVSNVNRPSKAFNSFLRQNILTQTVCWAGGLAVDWVNDKIYFSYGDPGSNSLSPKHLAIYDIATGGYVEISSIVDDHAVFHDLAVDPIGQ